MLFAAVDDEEQIAGYLELNPERWEQPDAGGQPVRRGTVSQRREPAPFRRDMPSAWRKRPGPGCWCWKPRVGNMPAIGFYLSQGFAIGGLDLFHYSNEDLERHEVRIEMMRMLESINAP